MYRAAGFEWGTPPGLDLAGCVEQWARLPLVFQPGSEWNYSVSSDVLGRLVEVVSGQPLDEFFSQRIFAPLGMNDTSFGTDDEDLAALYVPQPGTRKAVRDDAFGEPAAVGRTACLAAAAWCPRPPTTTGSPSSCCAEASWMGCDCSAREPSH